MRWQVLPNNQVLPNVIQFLADAEPPYIVTFRKGHDRTLSQNSLFHMWMGQIAKVTNDTPAGVKADCHIRWGIPLLRSEDEAYARFIGDALGGKTRKDVVMLIERGFVPCTSIMSVGQLSRYMDMIWREYSPHVQLTDPETLKYEGAA